MNEMTNASAACFLLAFVAVIFTVAYVRGLIVAKGDK